MADYYVDENGKITKKKKKNQPSYSVDLSGKIKNLEKEVDSQPVTKSKTSANNDDIAPVKKTENKRTWFTKGAFSDNKGTVWSDIGDTIGGTFKDASINFASGAAGIVESAIDAGAYIAGGVGGLFGADKFKDKTSKFIAKDIIDEEKVGQYIYEGAKLIANPRQGSLDIANNLLKTGKPLNINDDYEENSVFGEKSDALVQSAGQLGGTIALQSVGVPWFVTTGVTSFGGGVEEALNEGASYGKAGLSAAITAGADILTEKLFGGSGLGEKGLINLEPLTKGITSKVFKTLADFGVDVLAEGSEEVASGILSNLGSALYKEDNLKDILFSEEAIDEYIESFIGGAVLGGVMNTGNVGKSIKQGTDYRTGLTANEQKVFDKAYNDAISEAEKNGKKLTSKEKSKIHDNVMENLQKGYISTGTIEGVLGGETFGEYKSLTEQEKALTDEISQLENLPESQITVKQRERLLKAREELENLADKTELKTRLTDGVRNQINAESEKLTERGSFLDESYKEIERKKQAFKADLTQYNGKQREAVERAVKSGMLNDTNRSHEFVNILSKIEADKGIVFDYADNAKLKETGFAIDGKTVNGFVKDGAVTLNVQSAKSWQSVVGHEITHILEGTEAYSELQKSLFAYAESKGELTSRKSALTELYKNVDADIDAELTADLVGDYLFSDNDFIKHLTSNRTVFEKVYDEIKYLFKVATGKEKADIEKVKRQFDKVWEEFTAEDVAENNKVNYSVSADSEGVQLSKEQRDYFKDSKVTDENGNLKVMYHGSTNAGFHEFNNAFSDDNTSFFFTDSKNTAESYSGTSEVYSAKTFNTADDFNNFFAEIGADDYEVGEENGKFVLYDGGDAVATSDTAKGLYDEFTDYTGLGQGSANYKVYLNLTNPLEVDAKNAEWDSIPIPKEHLKGINESWDNPDPYGYIHKATTRQIAEYAKSQGYDGVIFKNIYDKGVYTSENEVNTVAVAFNSNQIKSVDNKNPTPNADIRYSLSETDNNGNELSLAVQKRFKNSKAVDENGNLKVLYHGTASGEFYTFDKAKGSVEGDFGSGFYFTDNESDVENNYEGGGADFENKVARRAEQIESEEDIDYDEAESRARKELYVGSNKFEVYLNIENPAIVGETNLLSLDSYYEQYDPNDYDSEIDYEGDVEQLISDDIDQIIWDIERNVDVDTTDGIAEVLWNAVNEGGIGIEKLKEAINNLYLEDSNGNLVGNEVTRQIIESLGYDGIIDNTVSSKFNMNLDEGTTHYIVFKPNQIKSITNQNPTDNPDIRRSLSKQGEQSTNGTPLKDLYYGDDIAPVKETQSTTDTQFTDNIAPITEVEADELDKQRIDSLTEAEAPPETNTEYYNSPDTTSLDNKALENIAKQLREKLSLTPQETRAIQEIVQEYSTSENPNKEELFNKIKEQFGEKVWKERIESIADVKRYLRTEKINVSDEVKKDITDYPQFRKKNANKINFSKDGLNIDTYYDELVTRFPDYFSYGVDEVYGDLTIPANQLRKIESVANLEIYETKTQDLDDSTIQSAVDIISNGITGYKNDLTMRAAEDTAKEALDSIAPAKAEQLTNGMRGEALLNQSLDNHPIATVDDRIAEKQRAVDAEIADNKQLRREAEVGYNAEIERLSEEYLSKKDKNTKVANNIIRRIAKLEKLKASVDADYAKRISDLEARAEKMKDPKYSRAMHKQSKMQENAQWAENLLGDTSTWEDKKIGLQYATNTERRNLRDIVRDENGNKDIAKADAIDDALNGRYNREEAAKKRELSEARKKYADLKITKAEDAYIQMLGELRHNPDTTLTEKVVNEFYEKHKNKIDTAKVDKVIELARQDYDSWLNRVNAELKKQGMREIPYRQGYFPHFTEPKQNFIQKLLNWKTQDNEIPTSIAGLTETFRPVRSWQSFDKTRYSDTTDYSFTKGFDTYSEGVLDWIYHLDTLQKRRAVENRIRFTHSEEGIQKRIKEVYADEGIDANEAQAQIEQILSEAKNPLNNFVQDFTTHTNILAGKKNSLDRTVEQATNRHIYSVMTNVQNRMSANMVLANVRSALTNFIPITQSWAQVSPLRSLQATKDTIANAIKDDGMTDKSTFLTNRLKEPDRLYKTNWDKILDKSGIMFEVIDNFASQVIWRSKYNQNLADGMTESEAIKNADQFSENVMAGRSKGNEPTLFNAKNPLVKAFTMFQLEVNNQYGYLFKDVPNDLKTETNHWKLNLAKGYTTAFIGAYAYNALMSQITGNDAALDPIGIIEDLLRDLGLLGDDEEKEPDDAVLNFGKNVVKELPFVGGVFGGGRIPINSALPYNDKGFVEGIDDFAEDTSKTVKATIDSIKNRDLSAGDWSGLKNFGKEMMNPILNIGLPVGGGQIKKTMQGLQMFNTDEDHPIAGSYTDNGDLRFPVDDTLANRVQAGIFGQWANENARDYIENGRRPLSPEQTQEFIDVELPIADYWKYREGLKGLKKNSEKADYINSLDIKDWQKSLLMNNILDRKEDVDMSNYDNYGSFEEFDYAEKNPEKYEFFKSNGISYEDYANADEDGKAAYTWAYNNPEKYKVSKIITDDVIQYRSYTSDLYDIKADKDANGKTIAGTGKSKKVDYINNLDLDYGQKIVLFKSQYKSDDTYNADIVNYINNRDDLSYDERVAIFKELGFIVSDGSVYWD